MIEYGKHIHRTFGMNLLPKSLSPGDVRAADMAAKLGRDIKVIVLATVDPDTVLIAVLDRGLEEGRDIALIRRVAQIVLTDARALS
jgi:hypothetical protein